MGLWTRIKRSMRALFGGIVEKTEDPELILQQTIRDMRDRIPDLNNSVAQVMATEKLLARNKERLETQVVDIDSKIKASIKMNRDDIATAYIGQLQQAQLDLQTTEGNRQTARGALALALGFPANLPYDVDTTAGGALVATLSDSVDALIAAALQGRPDLAAARSEAAAAHAAVSEARSSLLPSLQVDATGGRTARSHRPSTRR